MEDYSTNILSDEEVQNLILRFLEYRHTTEMGGGSKTEIKILLDWATKAKLMKSMLDLIINGEVFCDVENDDVKLILKNAPELKPMTAEQG